MFGLETLTSSVQPQEGLTAEGEKLTGDNSLLDVFAQFSQTGSIVTITLSQEVETELTELQWSGLPEEPAAPGPVTVYIPSSAQLQFETLAEFDDHHQELLDRNQDLYRSLEWQSFLSGLGCLLHFHGSSPGGFGFHSRDGEGKSVLQLALSGSMTEFLDALFGGQAGNTSSPLANHASSSGITSSIMFFDEFTTQSLSILVGEPSFTSQSFDLGRDLFGIAG